MIRNKFIINLIVVVVSVLIAINCGRSKNNVSLHVVVIVILILMAKSIDSSIDRRLNEAKRRQVYLAVFKLQKI